MLPAFTSYERGLVDWLSGVWIPREDGFVRPKVVYAGGEKAVLAIKAMRENRNQKVSTPVITIKLGAIEPNLERYTPPECTWGIVWNGPTKAQSTRAARIGKPAAYKCSYSVEITANYEMDLRHIMFNLLQRFHHHGGNLSYLTLNRPQGGKEFFPLWLRSFENATVSEGEGDREVKASMQLELEAYLPLTQRLVPLFKKAIIDIQIKGEPGIVAQIIVPEVNT